MRERERERRGKLKTFVKREKEREKPHGKRGKDVNHTEKREIEKEIRGTPW